jgi:hypothetical protein
MKLTHCELGLLINFNVDLLKNGFKRIIFSRSATGSDDIKL